MNFNPEGDYRKTRSSRKRLFGIPWVNALMIPQLGSVTSYSGRELIVDNRVKAPYQTEVTRITDPTDPHNWCQAELSTGGVARFESYNMSHGAINFDFSQADLYNFFLRYWDNEIKLVNEEWQISELPRQSGNLITYRQSMTFGRDIVEAAQDTFSGSVLKQHGYYPVSVKEVQRHLTKYKIVSAFFEKKATPTP